jgi:putative DNA primase/helicase
MALKINFGKSPGAANSDPFAMAVVLDLHSQSSAIIGVLKAGTLASLSTIDKENFAVLVAKQTGLSKSVIKKQFKELEAANSLSSTDGQTELALHVLKKHYAGGAHLQLAPDGSFWNYTGAQWQPVPETRILNALMETFMSNPGAFGEGKAAATCAGAMNVLRALSAVQDDPMKITLDPPPVINLQDGELWLDGDTPDLRPHRPASGLTCVLPVTYNPNATCPTYDAAIASIFGKAADPKDMVRHVEEVIGYAIQPLRPLAHIVLFEGSGANGKTSILKLIQNLVGPEQVFASPVGILSNDKFAKAELAGRLVFIDDDLREGVTLDDGLLKLIAEAKPLTARRAYGRRAFTFRSIALPILATNNTPRVNDASYGFERRLLIVPFARKFEKDEIKPDLFAIIIEKELPGVLNRALEGLARLRARKGFKEPIDALDAKKEFLAASNPLKGFVDDVLIAAPGDQTPVSEVYERFRAWCAHNGHAAPFRRKAMKGRLEGMNFKTHKSNPGVRYVLDVALTKGLTL